MNKSTIISGNDLPQKQIIIPHFTSRWVEDYFFQNIISHLQIDNCQNDKRYTFTLSGDYFSDVASFDQFCEALRWEDWTMTVYELNGTELIPKRTPMLMNVHATVPRSGDPQKAFYKIEIEGKVFDYLKEVNEVGSTIDWKVLKPIKNKYAQFFYQFLTLSQISQITEFSCHFNKLPDIFNAKKWRFDQWRRNDNDILEDILEEITNHRTHPIAFEYSTNQYFDKSIPEDRNSKYLYFRILAATQPLVQTLNPSPFIAMRPIYRLIANLKNQSQQGILYLFVAFIGLMLGNASALVDTIAESLMIIPCITVYLLVCVRLIYRHLHPSQT